MIYLRINTDCSQNDKNFTELIISDFTDPRAYLFFEIFINSNNYEEFCICLQRVLP